jgi:transmembrane sensor
LHGSERRAAVEAAFRSWLGENPANARAFETATEAWELGGAIAGAALPRISPTPRCVPRGRLKLSMAAAALALIGISAALLFRNPPVSTATGEQRTLNLDDGTRVTLNTNTKLVVDYTDKERRVRLDAGEAFFDVAKNPSRPFIVTAGAETVTALGTSFMVRRDDTEVDVTLVEGKVSVAPLDLGGASDLAPQVLAPGQRLRVAQLKTKLDEPNIDSLTAWRRGEVVLDHTRLSDAVNEMNRYSKIKLIVVDPETGNIPISGIFQAGDSARFARAIADTYRLQAIENPKQIQLTGSPPSIAP